jgi:uncharacterized membrane protein YeaQ/YmgE (transglycosylase-associated protein family)
VAPIELERVFERVEPFPVGLVAAVGQPAPCLQEHRGAEEAIAVPPVAVERIAWRRRQIYARWTCLAAEVKLNRFTSPKGVRAMSILWTIIIGFVAGVIAKFIMPGDNEPSGFILTAILGIVGAFVATYLGQALGWYGPGQGAGLIGAVLGASLCS